MTRGSSLSCAYARAVSRTIRSSSVSWSSSSSGSSQTNFALDCESSRSGAFMGSLRIAVVAARASDAGGRERDGDYLAAAAADASSGPRSAIRPIPVAPTRCRRYARLDDFVQPIATLCRATPTSQNACAAHTARTLPHSRSSRWPSRWRLPGCSPSWRLPAFHEWLAAYQLANHAKHLAETMTRARTEAVRRGHRVNLCKSLDRGRCADQGSWDAGFVVFVDVNRNGQDR